MKRITAWLLLISLLVLPAALVVAAERPGKAAIASAHFMATEAGHEILAKGGNAFDASAAMGFALHVVEPHLNGPLGDMPLLMRKAGDAAPTMVCGQGTAPAGATIAHYKSEGLTLIPGSGLLATVVPGAFGADLAAPVLFQVFARAKPAAEPLPAPPPGARDRPWPSVWAGHGSSLGST